MLRSGEASRWSECNYSLLIPQENLFETYHISEPLICLSWIMFEMGLLWSQVSTSRAITSNVRKLTIVYAMRTFAHARTLEVLLQDG